MECQLCQNKILEKILDLGLHPPPLVLLTEEDLKKNVEEKFPLEIVFCENCGLLQLSNIVDPKKLFIDYSYTSSSSASFKKHLHDFAFNLYDRFNLSDNDLVIDIASNDGTLLQGFQEKNVRVLGVEPSKVAKIAKTNGVPTINDFFNETVSEQIVSKYGKSKIITATNVFAHVDKLHSMMLGIKNLMDTNSVFVSESHYVLDLIEKLQYDTIYHEHLRFYGLSQLVQLFQKYNMDIFDVERISTHGGSIRVYSCLSNSFKKSVEVDKILQLEKEKQISTKKTMMNFAKKVHENKENLTNLLQNLKLQNKTIVGISAPARSSTILNFCDIDSSLLDFICEKSDLKINKFTPGSHIPIKSDQELIEAQPDYALLLSWHLAESIIPKIKNDGFKGQFIVPLPEVKILK